MVHVCRPIPFRDSVKQEAYILFGLCQTDCGYIQLPLSGIFERGEVRGPGKGGAGEQKLQVRLSLRAGLWSEEFVHQSPLLIA